MKVVDVSTSVGEDIQAKLVRNVKNATYDKIPKVRSVAKTLLDSMYTRHHSLKRLIDNNLNKDLSLDLGAARPKMTKIEQKNHPEWHRDAKLPQLFYKERPTEPDQALPPQKTEEPKNAENLLLANNSSNMLKNSKDEKESHEVNDLYMEKLRLKVPEGSMLAGGVPNRLSSDREYLKSSFSFRNQVINNSMLQSSARSGAALPPFFKNIMAKEAANGQDGANEGSNGDLRPSSTEIKRGMFVIKQPLEEMVKGRGWGANIRGMNYLKKKSGLANGGVLNNGSGGSEIDREIDILKKKALITLFEKNPDSGPNGDEVFTFGGFEFEDILIGDMAALIPENLLKGTKKLFLDSDGKLKLKDAKGNIQEVDLDALGWSIEENARGDKFIITKDGKRVFLDPKKGIPAYLVNGELNLGFSKELVDGMRGHGIQQLQRMMGVTQSMMRLQRMKEKGQKSRKRFRQIIKKSKKGKGKGGGKDKFMLLDREKGIKNPSTAINELKISQDPIESIRFLSLFTI